MDEETFNAVCVLETDLEKALIPKYEYFSTHNPSTSFDPSSSSSRKLKRKSNNNTDGNNESDEEYHDKNDSDYVAPSSENESDDGLSSKEESKLSQIKVPKKKKQKKQVPKKEKQKIQVPKKKRQRKYIPKRKKIPITITVEVLHHQDFNTHHHHPQEISALSIIEEGQDISELAYGAAQLHKPTIISIKKNSEFKKHQKGKRSIVWTYFTALDDKKAMCCICQKVISYCGTPTNLVYHLSRYHPAEGDVVKSKQANNIKYQYLANKLPKPSVSDKKNKRTINIIPQISDKHPTVTTIHPKKGNVTDKVIEMLLGDMLPVSILEGPGFKRLLHALDPTYRLPPVKEFFIELIPKKYYAEFKKVQQLLQNADKVHISLEVWTGYNDLRFLTMTSHFVTTEFDYKHYALSTIPVDTRATPEAVMTAVLSCVSQWDLSLDIMCIVTDGSEDMAKAAKLTGWKPVSCFAHMLDSIISEALRSSLDLTALINKCRNIVNFLRNNDQAKQQLLELQMHDKQMKLQMGQIVDINSAVEAKYPLKVKKDSPKEWISTFYMLQRIATLKNVMTKLLSTFSNVVECFTRGDWVAIEETISLLKAFEVVILELCNEPHNFASKVIPVTLGLMSLVNNCNTLTLTCVERVRKEILSALRKRVGQVEHNLTLAVATVLDPRFKNIAFQSENAVESTIQALNDEACKQAATAPLPASSHKETRDMSNYTDSLWACFDKKATPKKAPSRANDMVDNEIKHYLEEPLLDRKRDPFAWWKTQGQAQFPILARVAKQVLCIPATSIPPERVFLKKGRTFSEKRKLIKPKYIDQFMFLNLNIE